MGGDLGKKCNMLIYPSRYRGGDPRGCVLELIGFPVSQSGGPQGSFRASRHLQAPQMESGGPQRSNRVCRPSGSQGVWRPCSTPEDLETPPDTPNRVWRPSGVAQGLQTPPGTPNRVWRPSGVAQGPQGCWGGAPGGNRETVFLSPPIRGQPRNGVSVTSRSPFSVMGDRPSSVGGEERSLSVGGDLGKKCNMLIYTFPTQLEKGVRTPAGVY